VPIDLGGSITGITTGANEALTMTRPGDGYQALTHLKRDAVTQTIPVITISAHVADMEQERTTDATEAGGD